MRTLLSLFFGVLSPLILVCCARPYMVAGEKFSSSSEAIQRQSEIISSALKEITPSDTPVHGTVLIIFPSDVEIQKNYIGFARNSPMFPQEQIDFLITIVRNDSQFIVDAIRKRAIFDSISVARHNGNPASYAIGDNDYMVFRDVDGWFIRGKDNPRALLVNIIYARPYGISESIEAPKALVFLDMLSQQAKSLGSK